MTFTIESGNQALNALGSASSTFILGVVDLKDAKKTYLVKEEKDAESGGTYVDQRHTD